MCKHVAAVLYGVGARLDEKPELLFLLRGVDHEDLISAEVGVAAAAAGTKGSRRRIADDALADVFGIEMSEEAPPARARASRRRRQPAPKSKKTSRAAAKRTAKRKAKTGESTTRVKKKPASRKAGAKRAPRAAQSARPVTGKAVARLRAKFGMSRSRFAALLGVSAPSIGNWEKKPGTLNLQPRTLDAWNAAKGLTKRQAWRKVSRSRLADDD
jgi:DNA-binding transcriptional regulator YiaG